MKVKYQVLNNREIEKIVKYNGFYPISQNGSHIKYFNEDTKQSFVLTCKKVKPMLWRDIVKKFNLKMPK
jgi:predicted RNA binding protein YcfA (HicA-like mRNA interferase family)